VSDGVVSRPFLPREYFCVVRSSRRMRWLVWRLRASTQKEERAGCSPALDC